MKNQEQVEDHRVSRADSTLLCGDILESVISHVHTLDLPHASEVSAAWCLAAASSLRRRLKPLLLLHLPRASLAYDPHSRTWDPLPRRAPLTCPLRSSLQNLLFSLSPSRLSLSSHPFGATWIHLPPPRVSRVDPVVAQVGSCIVVAGGACYFENVAGAVEVFNLAGPTTSWTLCNQIPEDLAQSSSATWLSSATSAKLLYVLDKHSGVFSSFDPSTGKWSRTCELKPDRTTRVSAIGFSNGRLLLVGLSGSDPDPVSLKIWEVGFGLDLIKFTEIGRMPEEMVQGLAGSSFGLTTIGFGLVGDYGYFYNPGDFRHGAVFWEIEGGKWERVEMPDEVDQDPTAKIVFGCARVGLADLKRVNGSRV